MKVFCFYHKVDFDGQASAAIVKKFIPEAILVPFNYNVPFPYDEVSADDWVYFVDVSISPPDDMIRVWELLREKLVIIDHHQSFIQSEAGKWLRDKMDDNFYWDDVHAGCELTWMYFANHFPGSPIPMPTVIKLLGQYDAWRNTIDKMTDQDVSWDTVLQFQYGLRQREWSFEWFIPMLDVEHHHDINKIVETGETILEYQRAQNKITMSSSFVANIKGFKCLCVNSGLKNSQVFESKWDATKYDFMVPFCMTKERKWSWSFYSTRPDRDASQLAKMFGGGGHHGAAGAFTDDLIFDKDAS